MDVQIDTRVSDPIITVKAKKKKYTGEIEISAQKYHSCWNMKRCFGIDYISGKIFLFVCFLNQELSKCILFYFFLSD